MSIEIEFHFEDPFMSPPVIRPSPRLHSVPMLFPNIAALLPRATFHALIVPQACRVTPLSDILYHYRSPRVLPDTLGERFMSKLFPKRVVWHPRATFHAFIVPQACRVTSSGDVSCFYRSPSVSCGTLERRFLPLSFPMRALRNP